MQVFYQPLAPEALWLPEEESKHCSKVLRHQPGDTIWVTNGKNQLFACRLTDASPKRCTYSLLDEKVQKSRNFQIHLAIAPTKNTDRLEWMLEKCVELGIDEISLLQCQHSERFKINLERLLKKAISAMKQSLNFNLPLIHEPVAFHAFVENMNTRGESRYIAYVDEAPRPYLAKAASKENSCCILIGPEGDFSQEEIKTAFDHQFTAVSLGPNRLRTETAGLVACHTLHLINQL